MPPDRLGPADELSMLRTTARDLVRRAPVTTTTAASIRDAARVMAGRDVSSVVILNASRVVGIVTDRDLRRHVVATGLDPADSVVSIMTAGPLTVDVDARAFEVMLAMMDARIHHLPVVDSGRLVGVVTSSDLGRFEDADPVHLVRDIGSRADPAGVASACARMPSIVDRLARRGAGADDLGRVVTAIADAATTRAVQLAAAGTGLAPDAFCWVALGAHGRGELTLDGRQDNALVLADGQDEQRARDVAAQVVDTLLACGFPAGLVATTDPGPSTAAAWRGRVRAGLEGESARGLPPELFDARRVVGDPVLYDAVFGSARRVAVTTNGFARELVDATLRRVDELAGAIAAVDDRDVDGPALRTAGAIRDVARAFALEGGSARVPTPARLADAVELGAIDAGSAGALSSAYSVLAQAGVRMDVMRVPPTPADAAAVRSACSAAGHVARDLRASVAQPTPPTHPPTPPSPPTAPSPARVAEALS